MDKAVARCGCGSKDGTVCAGDSAAEGEVALELHVAVLKDGEGVGRCGAGYSVADFKERVGGNPGYWASEAGVPTPHRS